MSVQHTTENNEEARIKPKKTYQSFAAATSGLNLRLISQLRLLFEPTQEAGLPVSILEMYNMVFGYFIGVNYHDQSTLVGCALMKNEEIQSFKWLFQCWLRCMGGNSSKGILTN
ncbi:hypothetical protein Ahy_B06g084019 isoform B [Arachis hypogaea]|uniref:MULE transposase domain-containing protein n=1 Tax=Arachis hypogaea TaxID=3818 RepID=A0A444YQZ7_ARAHY|nr:hypothetical protein Ahy_B06g084019 isoform B [Arachis hypogaea]